MLDLGTVKPGSTIRIPFSSFDKDDGSSITMTLFGVGDILVYKDGNPDERASASGFTATTDFDAKTGKHLIVIDLADDTTAGFWTAGGEYLVAVDSVEVDAVAVGAWVARFRIGYPGAMLDTTITTLASQTSFTLTNGPAENDALNGCPIVLHDKAGALQFGTGIIADYVGFTKTVTLVTGVTFTAEAGDNLSVMFPPPAAVVVVAPVVSIYQSVALASTVGGLERALVVFQNTKSTFQWQITDGSGEALHVASDTIQFVVYDKTTGEQLFKVDGVDIAFDRSDPSGAPAVYDLIQVTVPSASLADDSVDADLYTYKLWDITLETIHGSGDFLVKSALRPS